MIKSAIQNLLKSPWLTREVWGWAMFDFANQAFTIVILTAMFQTYFVEHLVPAGVGADGEPDFTRGRALWGVAGVITEVLIILSSPIIGALADFSGAKKRLLFVTYLGAVAFTAALGFVTPGSAALGMALFIIGCFFYGSGENLLNAFLPELAAHRDMGKVSAFSWTIAYIGALAALAVAVLFTWIMPGADGLRISTLWAAVFFLAAGIPTFLWLKERKQAETLPPGQTMLTVGFHRIAATFRDLRRYRWLVRFIIVMTIYYCGTQVVFWFAASITKQFGFSDVKMGLFLLQLTLTAIVGAIITGRYQDRIGTKNTILLALVLWTINILGIAFTSREWMFWLVGNGIGLGIGALGTASRVMVALFSPPHKAGEFFGFWGLAHKLSVIIGVGGFSLLQAVLGPERFQIAVASNAGYFIVGMLLMLGIDERQGRVAALRSAREFERGTRPRKDPATTVAPSMNGVRRNAPIYLDSNATTQPASEVVAAMDAALREHWANPSSVHRAGQSVRQKVELARESVCRLIGCRDRDLVFTSGGTEAANLATLGSLAAQPGRRAVVTARTEHSAIRDVMKLLPERGVEVIWLQLDEHGVIDLEAFESLLKERAREIALVSLMWVNNETGVIQPIAGVGALCRAHGVRFHTDATQAVGKLAIDAASLPVDLLSFSAHKFHGPKGIGGLYLARGVKIESQTIGGPQERERRGGTENVPGIIGMGAAADLARAWLATDGAAEQQRLRDRFEQTIIRSIRDSSINGRGAERAWTTSSIAFARLEAEAILLLLSERGVCASAGAACSSGSLEPSPVLLAMGIPPELAHGSVRFSFSRFTTDAEIDQALEIIPAAIARLRGTLSAV